MNTWKTCAALLRQGRQTALFRDLAGGVVMTEEQAAQSARYAPLLDACPDKQKCGVYRVDGAEYCLQPLCTKPRMVICGGGHVACQTAILGNLLDFAVTVIDDREEFANQARFPFAQVLCLPFDEAMQRVEGGENCYFVIATRGHACDSLCLEAALKKERAYLGMIGSRSKVAHVMDRMRDAGFSDAELAEVYSPIGLAIGAVTPAEIAVSICAQIIEVKSRRRGGAFVGDDVLDSILSGKAAAVATILSQKGSSPRGAGAVMTVNRDGTISGTVGGGEAEQLTIQQARSVAPGRQRILQYDMTPKNAQQLGMVCGGTVRILVEGLEE